MAGSYSLRGRFLFAARQAKPIDAAKIIRKIESYAHTEFDRPEIKSRVQERLEKGEELLGREGFVIEKVQLDDTYPMAIRKNLAKYARFA